MGIHVQESERLMKKEEYAMAFGVSVPCVDKWAADGRVQKVKIGGKVYFKNIPPTPKQIKSAENE